MPRLTDSVTHAGLADRVFGENELRDVLGGRDARRYGLVNRALKDGSLRRLKRGVYVLNSRYRKEPLHPFAVAQSLHPGSYVSFETALSYHGWIPEAVFTTASVTPGRKTLSFDTPDHGFFTFHPLALQEYRLLTSVERIKLGASTCLIAKPLRALLDLVALRKEAWSGIEWMISGMRIDESLLMALKRKDFADLQVVHKHKAVEAFLSALREHVMPSQNAALLPG
ncbi:type IV toxin-antitoxin system AbiEi family antitoxin domain-containing protein [Novosphingobium rosa]|uniref:type IV toxin-antitoxin system AbiEi family antitoxin domain-containing protein n=1 Tax=Novosphingobium rosa TaxID=76978 RepID=UPI00083709BB|nr:hypothetical protein [Novosphingobium rosa]